MTPEKQDKTLELSKHWSVDSTPARNEVIMKRTCPVKSVKCDKIDFFFRFDTVTVSVTDQRP